MDWGWAKTVKVNNKIAREVRKKFFNGVCSFKRIGQRGKSSCARAVSHSNLDAPGRTTSNSHTGRPRSCLFRSCCGFDLPEALRRLPDALGRPLLANSCRTFIE